MIELIRVSKTFNKNRGLDDVSLRIEKGEWVILHGPAGAGKSTLLRMVYAAESPDSGEIIVGKHRLSSLKIKNVHKLRRLLGIVDQNLELLEDRTVLENVILVGDVLGWSRKTSRTSSLRVLNQVGLYSHLDSYPSKLSYGERHRLAIARAMVTEPFALIADEPLGHLDQETARGIVEVFAKFNSRGTSLLITSHQPDLFNGFPVRKVRLEKGRIIS